jgi:hypothetical protein
MRRSLPYFPSRLRSNSTSSSDTQGVPLGLNPTIIKLTKGKETEELIYYCMSRIPNLELNSSSAASTEQKKLYLYCSLFE